MAAPLAIKLTARQARTLVGEGILLDLGIRVGAPLVMEMPEWNRDRTTIHIQPRTAGTAQKPYVLTGTDGMRLHHVHPLSQVGQMMPVEAGRAWTAELNLFSYTQALAAGRYAVAVSYRYGNTADEVVRTNAVEIEVAPARLANATYRWFGGAEARETLASVWVGLDGAAEQWFYQVGSRRNPGAVETAVRLGMPAKHAGARPVLAQLNDIQAMHFLKYAVWEQDGELGVVAVHTGGRGGAPRFVKHGLQAGARLVDPPLQLHSGGLLALLTGVGADGKPGCSLVSMPEKGEGSAKVTPLAAAAEHAVALWPADERVPAVFLQGGAGGKIARMGSKGAELFGGRAVETVEVSQWMGAGRLVGYFREGGKVFPFAVESDKVSTMSAGTGYDAAKLGKFAGAAHREPGGVALLFAGANGWVVLDGGKEYAVPAATGADGVAVLLPAGKALFVVQHHPERGFLALQVGTAPPEALI